MIRFPNFLPLAAGRNALQTIILLSLVFLQSLGANPLEPSERAKLNEQIPDTLRILEERQPVHIVFLGDSRLLRGSGENKPGVGDVFLSELSKLFYYTGGIFDVYDEAHLDIEGAKLTYETLALDSPTCFDLLRFLSTRALINEPHLVVICAGSADEEEGVEPDRVADAWKQMKAIVNQAGAELAVVGPSPLAATDQGGYLHLLPSRSNASFLHTWTTRNKVPFLDAARGFLPSSFAFTERDQAVSVWKGLMTAVRERLAPSGTRISERQHRQLGKDLLASMLGQLENERRYLTTGILTRSSSGGMVLDVRIKNLGERTNEAWIFPMIRVNDASEWVGVAQNVEIPGEGTVDFSVPIATGAYLSPQLLGMYRGEMPCSLLIIDDRYVEMSDFSAALQPVGIQWRDRILRNQRQASEVVCQIIPNSTNLTSIPYRFHWNGTDNKGTLPIERRTQAELTWNLEFPTDESERSVSGDLHLYLGEGAGTIHLRRRIEAQRHFGLGERIQLHPTSSDALSEKETLIPPMLTLLIEAEKDMLSFHYDFRNLPLAANGRDSAIQLDLAIDGRHLDQRDQMSYVGRLIVHAGPDDGPAKVGTFELAQFGSVYERIPLPGGINAILSTRPNGDRRLTLGLSRTYFYRHSWALGNGNSQLGIGTNVEVGLEDQDAPVRYELIRNRFHPNDAAGLMTLEMTENPTPRWTVRFWDE